MDQQPNHITITNKKRKFDDKKQEAENAAIALYEATLGVALDKNQRLTFFKEYRLKVAYRNLSHDVLVSKAQCGCHVAYQMLKDRASADDMIDVNELVQLGTLFNADEKKISKSRQNNSGKDVLLSPENIPTDEIINYYFINSMRCVWPYKMVVNCQIKFRHLNMSLRNMINAEFPSFHDGYLDFALKNNRILINGKIVTICAENTLISDNMLDVDKYKLQNGDVFQHVTHSHEPPVPSSPIQIIYNSQQNQLNQINHDDIMSNLLIINKPSGIPVHATGRYRHNTIIGILQHYFKTHTPSHQPHPTQLHIVHRLDIATSGLLLLSTNHKSANLLSSLMASRQVQKHYIARVVGKFPMYATSRNTNECKNVQIITQWGKKKWKDDFSCGDSIQPNDLHFDWNHAINQQSAMIMWAGVGIRTVESFQRSNDPNNYQHSLLSYTSPPQFPGYYHNTLDFTRPWDCSDKHYEIVVDRPIEKHHQNNMNNDNNIKNYNNNGNYGVMHTPYLTKDDLLTFKNPAKFSEGPNSQLQQSSYGNNNKKHSLTIFRGLSYDPETNTSLVHCMPKTGRTHQIRVHLAHIGFPISNDVMYTPPTPNPWLCPSDEIEFPINELEHDADQIFLNKSHYTCDQSNSPQYDQIDPIMSYSKNPLTIDQYQSTSTTIDTVDDELALLWERSFDPGCCFCLDVNSGLWPEKRLMMKKTQCDENSLDSEMVEAVYHHNVTTSSVDGHSTHTRQLVFDQNPAQPQHPTYAPQSSNIQSFPESNQLPSPIQPVLVVPLHPAPMSSELETIDNIEWKAAHPNAHPIPFYVHTNKISHNVYPAMMSINEQREFIYLHAMRYETDRWSFCVPAPNWAKYPSLNIPSCYYTGPELQ